MSEIIIENLCKTYRSKDGTVEALKHVNLNVGDGDIYGIIGMSGAGKSTLVRCMNFLERPTEGRVLIKGQSLGSLPEKELRRQRERCLLYTSVRPWKFADTAYHHCGSSRRNVKPRGQGRRRRDGAGSMRHRHIEIRT